MISSSKEFIFIHLTKTGGNSVQDALREYADDDLVTNHDFQDGVERFDLRNKNHKNLVKHSTLSDYRKALGKEIAQYQIYTTIRNPFDRLVSFYFSPHRGNVDWSSSDFEKFIIQLRSLEDFLMMKKSFFSRAQPDISSVNLFLRFEHLDEDFGRMCDKLGLKDVSLPHRNKSSNRMGMDYRECFSTELREWVEQKHALEIHLGEYSF